MSSLRRRKNITFHLKKILEQLPEKKEKEEIITGINELIKFLDRINKSFETLPTLEEAKKAKNTLEKLENILERNPLIEEIFLSKRQKKVSKPSIIDSTQEKGTSKEIKEEVERFLKMPEDELRSCLLKEKRYTKKTLIAILSELGIRVSKKTLKKQLIEEIVTTIVNSRTYKGLRSDRE